MKEGVIQKWLYARQNVIIALKQLCELRPFIHTQPNRLKEATQEFCEQLMDYASFGHFGIYDQLTAAIEKTRSPFVKKLPQLLSALLQTTCQAVTFNDRQLEGMDNISLENELSYLAEQLAKRFEWEDSLVHAYSMARMHTQLAKTA
jgi:regulator of sigma D